MEEEDESMVTDGNAVVFAVVFCCCFFAERNYDTKCCVNVLMLADDFRLSGYYESQIQKAYWSYAPFCIVCIIKRSCGYLKMNRNLRYKSVFRIVDTCFFSVGT